MEPLTRAAENGRKENKRFSIYKCKDLADRNATEVAKAAATASTRAKGVTTGGVFCVYSLPDLFFWGSIRYMPHQITQQPLKRFILRLLLAILGLLSVLVQPQ